MSNPYLPKWEYIPDGEPKVFGDRVYIYGSHDKPNNKKFCDYKLKVWSAPVNDPGNWTCHGDVFHTRADFDHISDVDWSDKELYAPDVVEKDGKYYLFAYIVDSEGCVAVADRPEGPFKMLSKYKLDKDKYSKDALIRNGIFIDPGVLVDDDGRVYIFCGYKRSFAVELKQNMYEVIDESYVEDIIPALKEENGFFEACSPRKIGDKYYLIYSPSIGSRLDYAVSDKPLGPYELKGTIIDNGIDYPGGNNHGSICEINGEWYVFYHRTTNGTCFSRRGCVEKISILEDGTISRVEMTSLGFDKALSPYELTPADVVCVLKGGAKVCEENIFVRKITNIKDGCVIGVKYYDFGIDYSSKTMKLHLNVKGGEPCRLHVLIDDYISGEEIGCIEVGKESGVYSGRVKNVTGTHAVFLKVERLSGAKGNKENNSLFELFGYIFSK